MAIPGIQGRALDITVIGCLNLVDKPWSVRQDSYVSLQYGSSKRRTKTCTDGGINPAFQEKFSFELVEGVQELLVMVWNSHIVATDGLLGYQSYAGDIRLVFHFPNANTAQPEAARPAILSQLLPYGSSPQPALNPQPVIPGYSVPYSPTTNSPNPRMYIPVPHPNAPGYSVPYSPTTNSPNPRMYIPVPHPNAPIAGYHGPWSPAFYSTHHPQPQAWAFYRPPPGMT